MWWIFFDAVGFAADPQTLWNVDMDFCKGWNRLAQYVSTGSIDNDIKTISGLANYTIAAPKRWAMIDENGDILVGICMLFSNVWEEPVDIDLGIVDGEFAYGAQAVQACKTTAEGVFGKGVTFIGGSTITVPAKDKIEKRAIFRIPKWFAGSVHGCITYSVSGKKGGEGTISIIDRKANLVDFIIPGILENRFGLISIFSVTDGNTQIDAYGEKTAGNDMIQVRKKYDENRMNVIMGLENSWYVDTEYTVQILRTGLMGLIYGETKSGTGSLYPQEKILYHQSLTWASWYDGWVDTTILLQHRPVQQWDMSPQERKTIRYTFSFLWTPIYIVVTIAVILLLMGRWGVAIVRRKFKRSTWNESAWSEETQKM